MCRRTDLAATLPCGLQSDGGGQFGIIDQEVARGGPVLRVGVVARRLVESNAVPVQSDGGEASVRDADRAACALEDDATARDRQNADVAGQDLCARLERVALAERRVARG